MTRAGEDARGVEQVHELLWLNLMSTESVDKSVRTARATVPMPVVMRVLIGLPLF